MTTKADKYANGLSALQWVLAQRLKHSRSWQNVSLSTNEQEGKPTFEIRWIHPKDPDTAGTDTFMSRVLPLNKRSLDAEVRRQILKYVEEFKG